MEAARALRGFCRLILHRKAGEAARLRRRGLSIFAAADMERLDRAPSVTS